MFLINADDFGMSKGVNEAIYELVSAGIINSCSIMCNMKFTNEAIEMIKILYDKNVKFNLNLHFNITEGKSIFDDKMFNKNNKFIKDTIFIKEELICQLNFLKKNGINVDGIDCHHNINLNNETINNVIKEMWNRRIRDNMVYKGIYNNINDLSLVVGLISKKYNEIMLHPSTYVDDCLRNNTIYCKQRVDEYKLIKSNATLIKKVISQRNCD